MVLFVEKFLLKNNMKKIALHWKIIIGMALGILYGVIVRINLEHFTFNWIKPWGIIFINLLKLIAVPLIFASILKGITSLFDVSKLSRIGGKTIILYLISTILSVSIGLILVILSSLELVLILIHLK